MRVAFTIVGITVMAALAAQAVQAQSRGLGRINGTVAAESGEPIAGVIVKVEVGDDSIEGKSDGTGKWAVSGLGKGQFFVEFLKAGFETKRVRLVIEKETMQSDPIKIQLKKGE